MSISATAESSCGLMFRCRRNNHDKRLTLSDNTWFEECRISIEKCLQLTYLISRGQSYDEIEHELFDNDFGIGTSRKTIAERYKMARKLYSLDLGRQYANMGKIAGPGSVVEVDEMKFGKRKYNVGRVIEGSWLVGIIHHDTNELRIDICPNNVRDANNLLRIINKHVEKGATIMTDCWKAYNVLTADGFNHLTVFINIILLIRIPLLTLKESSQVGVL
jgi:transposase-like protein